MDYSNALTDESRLQELLNDYQKKKTALTAGEGIFNALNNVPTLGQAMGKIPRAQEQNINLTQLAGEDPRLVEKNRIAGVLQNLEIAKAKRDEDASRLALQQGETDRAGMASMLTPLAKKYGIEVTPGMSTGTLKTASDLIKSQSELAQKKYASDEANRLRADLADARNEARQEKLASKESEMNIPGYTRSPEIKPQGTEVKALRSAVTASKSLFDNIDKMKDLVDKYGSFEAGGVGGAEMKSLARDIQLSAKNEDLYKLGVLTGPDLRLLEDIIANPSSLESLFTRDKTRQSELDTFKNSIATRLKAASETLGYKPVQKQTEQTPKVPGQSGMNDAVASDRIVLKRGYNPKTNQTQVIYSDGTKEVLDGKR